MLFSVLKSLKGGGSAPETRNEPSTEGVVSLPRFTYQRGGWIVAFVTTSRGDALKQHTLEIIEPFRSRCAGIEVIDLLAPDWSERFVALANVGIWFVFAPFGSGEVFWVEEGEPTSPWMNSGIPFIRMFGDSPAYFPARHAQPCANSINAYGHIEHQEVFMRWHAPKAPVLTLPLFPFDKVAREAVDVSAKAKGPIVFPKNGNCPELLAKFWRESLPHEMFIALRDVAEEADACLDTAFDPTTAIVRHFARLSIDLSMNLRLTSFLTAQIDDHLRRRKSTMIARSLLDFPVTIRGDNWDHIDFSGRRAKHDPDSDYVRTRGLLDGSMAILDMSPNTQRGPHDRVLRAAGRYTAFLTNQTEFYLENFAQAKDFTFQFTPESIRDRVERALSHPRETVEMGLDQAARMGELLTVERFVEQVATVVDLCALACGERPEGTQDFVSYEVV